MGLWFFLTVVVMGHFALKAYKLRMISQSNKSADDRVNALEMELKIMRDKLNQLDEAVFFGDFDLKRQFRKLEHEMSTAERQR